MFCVILYDSRPQIRALIVRLKEKERHAFTGLALFIVCINLLPSSSALIVLCKDSDYSLNIKIISFHEKSAKMPAAPGGKE